MIINTKSDEAGGVIQSTLLIKGDDDNVLEVSMSYDGQDSGALPSIGVLLFATDGIRLNPSQIQTLADYLGVAHLQNQRILYGPEEG